MENHLCYSNPISRRSHVATQLSTGWYYEGNYETSHTIGPLKSGV
jgi:hypothetical protein